MRRVIDIAAGAALWITLAVILYFVALLVIAYPLQALVVAWIIAAFFAFMWFATKDIGPGW